MPTIDTLAYKMVLDYSQFTQGMVVTRKELSLAKQLTAQFATENEKFAMSMDVLNKLYEKDAISVQTYDRAVDSLINKQKELSAVTAQVVDEGTTPLGKSIETVNPIADKLLGNILKMGPGLYALDKGLRLASAGWSLFKEAARAAYEAVKEQFFETDKLIEQAQMLGMSSRSLVTFQTLGEPMGVSQSQIADALQNMVKGAGQAADGMGRLKKVFALLNLDAKELVGLSVEQQFMKITGAINRLSSEGERMAVAEKIFGTADAVKLLGISMADLVTQSEKMKAVGLGLDPEQDLQIAKANDAIDEMTQAWTGLARVLAADVAPAVQQIAIGLRGIREAYPNLGMGTLITGAQALLPARVRGALDIAGLGMGTPGQELGTAQASEAELDAKLKASNEKMMANIEAENQAAMDAAMMAASMSSFAGSAAASDTSPENIGRRQAEAFAAELAIKFAFNNPLMGARVMDTFEREAYEKQAKEFNKADEDKRKLFERNVDKVVGERMKETGPNIAMLKGSSEALRAQHALNRQSDRLENKRDQQEMEKQRLLSEIARNTAIRETYETVEL